MRLKKKMRAEISQEEGELNFQYFNGNTIPTIPRFN